MEQLGATIARQLRAGDLVLLNGELGAGKTTLTRGLGAELGPVVRPMAIQIHPAPGNDANSLAVTKNYIDQMLRSLESELHAATTGLTVIR